MIYVRFLGQHIQSPTETFPSFLPCEETTFFLYLFCVPNRLEAFKKRRKKFHLLTKHSILECKKNWLFFLASRWQPRLLFATTLNTVNLKHLNLKQHNFVARKTIFMQSVFIQCEKAQLENQIKAYLHIIREEELFYQPDPDAWCGPSRFSEGSWDFSWSSAM